MSGETKSQGQKDELDRFYTDAKIAQRCVNLFNLLDYDCIIEPSAGSGSFSSLIPNCYAYDIAPQEKNIQQADWLKKDKTEFLRFKNILVIGNPPFGQQNSLAIKFFNESAKIASVIGFILPKTFKKSSLQNLMDLNFWLKEEVDLEECEFFLKGVEKIKVPCVFQIWEKRNIPRKKQKLKTTTPFFDFVDKDKADFRIQRVGGNAGKASFDLDYSPQSNYFIKNNTKMSNEEFVLFINSLSFPSITYTVGPKSLGKGELIEIFEEKYLKI
jgi:hypothetical protein